MWLISLPLLVRIGAVIKKLQLFPNILFANVQLFSAGRKSVAKTAYFHKNIILTKWKSHALSFLGCLTSISPCSIWNMAIGNEDAQVLKAHLLFEWQPAQHCVCTLFMLMPAQNRWEQGMIMSTVRGHLHFQLHSCVQDLTMSIGSSSLPFHVLSGCYARWVPWASEGNSHFQSVR